MWEKGVGHLVNEKEGILMKVLFCKIHCPIMCFCKPHIYNSDSTNTHQYHVSSTAVADAASESDESSCSEVKEEECLDVKEEKPVVLKSCVKKIHSDESDVVRDKKRVSWVDDLGLELAEVKEFESRYHKEQIEKIIEDEAAERKKVMTDSKAIVPTTFVSFKSRWGAAVCAQTTQSSDTTIWLICIKELEIM